MFTVTYTKIIVISKRSEKSYTTISDAYRSYKISPRTSFEMTMIILLQTKR